MLYKSKTLAGHTLLSLDGEIGKAKEFYFDDQHWTIRYLVADTGNWLTGRLVLISPYALETVNEENRQIAIDLTRAQIESSPSVAATSLSRGNSRSPTTRTTDGQRIGPAPTCGGGPALYHTSS